MAKVTEKTNLLELIKADYGVVEILKKHQLDCLGCPAAVSETLADIGKIHGINVNELIEEINEWLERETKI